MRILHDPYSPDTILYELDVEPCTAPRQTQQDKWKVRPEVAKYREFRDRVWVEWRKTGVEFPEEGALITFWIPFPKSYTKKRREELAFQPHRGLKDNAWPMDKDNLEKAFLDAIFRRNGGDDSHIWDSHTRKFWTSGRGCIRVEIPVENLTYTSREFKATNSSWHE